MDIGILMTGYGVPAVASPEASRAVPMVAAIPNRLLPRAALMLADAGKLITFPGPVNAVSVAYPAVLAVGAIRALREHASRRRR